MLGWGEYRLHLDSIRSRSGLVLGKKSLQLADPAHTVDFACHQPVPEIRDLDRNRLHIP
jgi:hypothetical protein